MKKVLSLLLLVMLAIQLPAAAQDKLGKSLDKIIDQMDKGKNAPGGTIAVSKGTTLLYSRSFGSADLEHNVDFTENTVTESGSVAKQFTATAVLLLVNDGKIDPEDDIRKYIPELKYYGDTMRVRHLLTHTSGLKDWGVLFGMAGAPRGTKAYTMKQALDVIYRQSTLNFPPGTQYSYSNSNFIVLYEVVQRVSGIPFTSFCKQHIFDPAGMSYTQWRDDFRNIVPGRAQAYGFNKTEKRYHLDMPFDHVIAAGALLTTSGDMLNWNRFWARKGFGEKVSALRTTPGHLKDGRNIHYALGAVFVNPVQGAACISHSGLTAGYRTWVAYFPETDISIVVLCNGVEKIPTEDIAAAVLENNNGDSKKKRSAKTWPLREEQVKALAGTYAAIRGHHIIEIEKKNERLYFSTGAELLAMTKDTLTTGSRKMVHSADNNSFLSVIGEDTLTYRRVFKTNVNEAQLTAYKGTYYSSDVQTTVNLTVRNGRLYFVRYPATNAALTPAYLDAFFMGNDLIKFAIDTNQKITGFYLSSGTGRADDVFFKRSSQ
jgi:CubicO group peptidase (beta-lactamase class C family)